MFALLYPQIDPVFLQLGPLAFRWYGMMYALSFILAYFLIQKAAVLRRVPITQEEISDLMFYVAMGVVFGGRLGYVFFYNPNYYFSHPTRIFAVWEGGMAFHGGLIGSATAVFLYCKNKKRSFYSLADISVMSGAMGLGLGRIGNFINGELFGRPTNLPWCMVFPEGGPVCRHPSQLYQAVLEGGVIFAILWTLSGKKLATGSLFWCLILFYGLFRFLVEFVRQPDAHIGFLFQFFSMGQLLSLPMFLVGSFMFWYLNRRKGA
jgi:phosphatidylglycerol:prolipoprotein diacylglycerol transferase